MPLDLVSFIELFPFLLFPVIWIAVVSLVATASGWRKLYQDLGAHSDPQVIGESSKVFRFPTIRFNRTNYKNSITINTTRYALIMKVFFPFRLGHKPLVIPWDRVESLTPEQFFFVRYVKIKLTPPLKAEILVPEAVFINNSHVPSRLSFTQAHEPAASSSQNYKNPYQ